MKDLFGNKITVEQAKVIERKRRRKTLPNGNAAPRGSGPAGETCGSCEHAYRSGGHGQRYYKCRLVKPTRGIGTDIRLKWLACSRWIEKGVKG